MKSMATAGQMQPRRDHRLIVLIELGLFRPVRQRADQSKHLVAQYLAITFDGVVIEQTYQTSFARTRLLTPEIIACRTGGEHDHRRAGVPLPIKQPYK